MWRRTGKVRSSLLPSARTSKTTGDMLDIVLAPAERMEFRDLEEDALKPGTTVSIVAFPHKRSSHPAVTRNLLKKH